ncbi:MAG TPA: hypothetical protein PKA63_14235 [Oligoflexia bacterium]|nr:hypothetical protein [Oligoflexia bacterium]HMP49823.1 hypothetical protein [Oligoflexia bacterium]
MSKVLEAIEERDSHLRDVIKWHFNEKTGCDFWLEQKSKLGFDPIKEIHGLDDLVRLFENFDGDKHLRTVSASRWKPRGFQSCKSWSMFMTGGTTGDPKRRWGRLGKDPNDSDYAWDYHTFSKSLPKAGFPSGGSCLYIGPGGPRRLPLGVEILAYIRESGFNKVDMDVAWMKDDNNTVAKQYKNELVRRAIGAIRRDQPDWIFCPPVLIEAIGELIDWTTTSVKGVFAGGTEMDPETIRNIMEVLFKGEIHLVPTYGNALVGLAQPRTVATFSRPIQGQRPYSVIYQPLQPRTLLRVTKRENSRELVEYGERGFVEITTATYEWFMPRFRERDMAERVAPTEAYPWDGVAEVGPPPEDRATLKKGVY